MKCQALLLPLLLAACGECEWAPVTAYQYPQWIDDYPGESCYLALWTSNGTKFLDRLMDPETCPDPLPCVRDRGNQHPSWTVMQLEGSPYTEPIFVVWTCTIQDPPITCGAARLGVETGDLIPIPPEGP